MGALLLEDRAFDLVERMMGYSAWCLFYNDGAFLAWFCLESKFKLLSTWALRSAAIEEVFRSRPVATLYVFCCCFCGYGPVLFRDATILPLFVLPQVLADAC